MVYHQLTVDYVDVKCQVETECRGRVRLLNAAQHQLRSFDAGVNHFDSWLCGAESQLRIMQRSVGDLHKFRQQTTDLQVTCAHTAVKSVNWQQISLPRLSAICISLLSWKFRNSQIFYDRIVFFIH